MPSLHFPGFGPGLAVALAPGGSAPRKSHLGTGQRGRETDGRLLLPYAYPAYGVSGFRDARRVDTFFRTGPKRLFGTWVFLGPGQDLENHRGKSRSSGEGLGSLGPTFIKVQGGPIPFLPNGDRRRRHLDPGSQE